MKKRQSPEASGKNQKEPGFLGKIFFGHASQPSAENDDSGRQDALYLLSGGFSGEALPRRLRDDDSRLLAGELSDEQVESLHLPPWDAAEAFLQELDRRRNEHAAAVAAQGPLTGPPEDIAGALITADHYKARMLRERFSPGTIDTFVTRVQAMRLDPGNKKPPTDWDIHRSLNREVYREILRRGDDDPLVAAMADISNILMPNEVPRSERSQVRHPFE